MSRKHFDRPLPLHWLIVVGGLRVSVWAQRGQHGKPAFQFDLPAMHRDGSVIDLCFVDAIADFINIAALRRDFDGFVLVADNKTLREIQALLTPEARNRLLGTMLRYGAQQRTSLAAAATMAAVRSPQLAGGVHV